MLLKSVPAHPKKAYALWWVWKNVSVGHFNRQKGHVDVFSSSTHLDDVRLVWGMAPPLVDVKASKPSAELDLPR